jgi:NTE family protein
MIAIVMSGGGSRGAFEVGALKALCSHGIRADMLVGSSVGAVNASGMALEPTLAGVSHLEDLWLEMEREDFYSNNPLVTALRLAFRKPSLYSNQRMYRLVRTEIQSQAPTFADLNRARLYLTGVDLEKGDLHIFGDDPSESVVDAIMASTAIQPYFAPWSYRGCRYVDGGLVSNLPLLVALKRGATEIYALDVTFSPSGAGDEKDLVSLLRNEAWIVIDRMRRHELFQARKQLGSRLHHIHYTCFPGLMPFDFSHTAEMIADGEAMMAAYLERIERDLNPISRWKHQRRDQRGRQQVA